MLYKSVAIAVLIQIISAVAFGADPIPNCMLTFTDHYLPQLSSGAQEEAVRYRIRQTFAKDLATNNADAATYYWSSALRTEVRTLAQSHPKAVRFELLELLDTTEDEWIILLTKMLTELPRSDFAEENQSAMDALLARTFPLAFSNDAKLKQKSWHPHHLFWFAIKETIRIDHERGRQKLAEYFLKLRDSDQALYEIQFLVDARNLGFSFPEFHADLEPSYERLKHLVLTQLHQGDHVHRATEYLQDLVFLISEMESISHQPPLFERIMRSVSDFTFHERYILSEVLTHSIRMMRKDIDPSIAKTLARTIRDWANTFPTTNVNADQRPDVLQSQQQLVKFVATISPHQLGSEVDSVKSILAQIMHLPLMREERRLPDNRVTSCYFDILEILSFWNSLTVK